MSGSRVNPIRTIDGEQITRSQSIVLFNLAAERSSDSLVSSTLHHLIRRGFAQRTRGTYRLTARGAALVTKIKERGVTW